MDQSRPRHKPGHEKRQQQPLIIERSDLAHPVRRVLALLFTLLAWGLWIGLWLPVFGSVAAQFGIELPWVTYPGQLSLQALRVLVGVFPLAVGLVLLVLAVNGLVSRIHRRFNPPAANRFVGMDRLAAGMALDAGKLATWQSARILHVEHGPQGRVIDAHSSLAAFSNLMGQTENAGLMKADGQVIP